MSDRVSIVTRLILDRPTCPDCIGKKSGLTTREVDATLGLIADALKVYREPDRCHVCDETREVFSVKRLTPSIADPACAQCDKPILPTDHKATVQNVPYHYACWDRKTRKTMLDEVCTVCGKSVGSAADVREGDRQFHLDCYVTYKRRETPPAPPPGRPASR
jgi:hypothetical protein